MEDKLLTPNALIKYTEFKEGKIMKEKTEAEVKVRLSIDNIGWARIITEKPRLFTINTKLTEAEDSLTTPFLGFKTINFTDSEFSQLLNHVKSHIASGLPPSTLRSTNALLNQLQKYC